MSEFVAWPKTPRWKNEHIVITEKIDGTNAQIYIHDDLETVEVGSRNRWITPEDDNYGFAKWAFENKQELLKLGRGRHFGEWWGSGIQRGYNQTTKRFSLFNTERPWDSLPTCVEIVPVLYRGEFSQTAIDQACEQIKQSSVAVPGFTNAEGICIYMRSSKQVYKIPFNK